MERAGAGPWKVRFNLALDCSARPAFSALRAKEWVDSAARAQKVVYVKGCTAVEKDDEVMGGVCILYAKGRTGCSCFSFPSLLVTQADKLALLYPHEEDRPGENHRGCADEHGDADYYCSYARARKFAKEAREAGLCIPDRDEGECARGDSAGLRDCLSCGVCGRADLRRGDDVGRRDGNRAVVGPGEHFARHRRQVALEPRENVRVVRQTVVAVVVDPAVRLVLLVLELHHEL